MQANPAATALPHRHNRWLFAASFLLSDLPVWRDPRINRAAIIYPRCADAYLQARVAVFQSPGEPRNQHRRHRPFD